MRNCCVAFQRSRVGAGMNRFAKGVKCNARLSGPKNWMRYIKTRLYLFYSHRIDLLNVANIYRWLFNLHYVEIVPLNF